MFCDEAVPEFSNGSVCQNCWDALAAMRVDCLRCGQQYPAGRCAECAQCRPLAYMDIARSHGRYRGGLGKILRQYKYRADRSLAPGLARLLESTFLRNFVASEWTFLTGVPTHPARVRVRGFDHLDLLGRLLARRIRLPFCSVLSKSMASRPQAGLSETQRRRNVRRSFVAKESLGGKRILLLDDILTTGATINECARILKRAGAARVGALTVGRAE
ncbi:MAG TPA: ComF family protein [Acidobacteriota bacterium]|jgi:ComF family protein|nr:ComF family protein [Acidobacteriota bacterium]